MPLLLWASGAVGQKVQEVKLEGLKQFPVIGAVCSREGSRITLGNATNGLLNSKCFECFCRNRSIICSRKKCPPIPSDCTLTVPTADGCCTECAGCRAVVDSATAFGLFSPGAVHSAQLEKPMRSGEVRPLDSDKCSRALCDGAILTVSRLVCDMSRCAATAMRHSDSYCCPLCPLAGGGDSGGFPLNSDGIPPTLNSLSANSPDLPPNPSASYLRVSASSLGNPTNPIRVPAYPRRLPAAAAQTAIQWNGFISANFAAGRRRSPRRRPQSRRRQPRALGGDLCVRCEIVDQNWEHCFRLACPVVHCPVEEQRRDPDQCCPRCARRRTLPKALPGLCNFNGRILSVGQQFRPDDCTQCDCTQNGLRCRRFVCAVECRGGVYRPQVCCPFCGLGDREDHHSDVVAAEANQCEIKIDEKRIVWKDRDRWQPDACTVCDCRRGAVVCESRFCAPLLCPKGRHLPVGECCPVCRNASTLAAEFPTAVSESAETAEIPTELSDDLKETKTPKIAEADGQTVTDIDAYSSAEANPLDADADDTMVVGEPIAERSCQLDADGILRSFDGLQFSVRRPCAFVAARQCHFFGEETSKEQPATFIVRIHNDRRGKLRRVSIRVDERNGIKLGTLNVVKGKFLKYRGRRLQLPLSTRLFSASLLDGLLNVDIHSLGLRLLWIADSSLRLSAHPKHFGTLCGLCGNFNGDPDDDMLAQFATTAAATEEEFVESWRDDADTQQCSEIVDSVETLLPDDREEPMPESGGKPNGDRMGEPNGGNGDGEKQKTNRGDEKTQKPGNSPNPSPKGNQSKSPNGGNPKTPKSSPKDTKTESLLPNDDPISQLSPNRRPTKLGNKLKNHRIFTKRPKNLTKTKKTESNRSKPIEQQRAEEFSIGRTHRVETPKLGDSPSERNVTEATTTRIPGNWSSTPPTTFSSPLAEISTTSATSPSLSSAMPPNSTTSTPLLSIPTSTMRASPSPQSLKPATAREYAANFTLPIMTTTTGTPPPATVTATETPTRYPTLNATTPHSLNVENSTTPLSTTITATTITPVENHSEEPENSTSSVISSPTTSPPTTSSPRFVVRSDETLIPVASDDFVNLDDDVEPTAAQRDSPTQKCERLFGDATRASERRRYSAKCAILRRSPILRSCHSQLPIKEFLRRCVVDLCECEWRRRTAQNVATAILHSAIFHSDRKSNRRPAGTAEGLQNDNVAEINSKEERIDNVQHSTGDGDTQQPADPDSALPCQCAPIHAYARRCAHYGLLTLGSASAERNALGVGTLEIRLDSECPPLLLE